MADLKMLVTLKKERGQEAADRLLEAFGELELDPQKPHGWMEGHGFWVDPTTKHVVIRNHMAGQPRSRDVTQRREALIESASSSAQGFLVASRPQLLDDVDEYLLSTMEFKQTVDGFVLDVDPVPHAFTARWPIAVSWLAGCVEHAGDFDGDIRECRWNQKVARACWLERHSNG